MNIKDTYTHGSQSVIKGLTSLSITNGKLVLQYTKAEPLNNQGAQTVYNLELSNFYSQLDNRFLKLTGGELTGDLEMNTTTTDNIHIYFQVNGRNYGNINCYGEAEDVPYPGLHIQGVPYLNLDADSINISASSLYFNESKVLTANDISGGGSTWGSSITVDSHTLTIPSNPNTDHYVTQTNKTDNVYYPLLLGRNYNATAASISTSEVTNQAYFNSGVYLNPSTKTIYATTFNGNATSASSLSVTHYWANVAISTSATYNKQPMVKSITVSNNTTNTTTNSGTMQYNTNTKSIDFIFN